MSHPEVTYRRDIDGLRAVAIIPVLVFHAFPSLLPGGFVGVDVFFVISGFLISRIILRELEASRFSFVEFYLRRARRILPSLALVLLAVLLAGGFLLLPLEYERLGKHIAAGAAFISNFVLLGESGYFDTASETNPLLHLWSLAVEEQFYLAWPLLLFFAWRVPWLRRPAVGGLFLMSFVMCIWWVRVDQALAFYSPFSRLWELALGAMLAQQLDGSARGTRPTPLSRAEPGQVSLRARNIASWLGASLIAVAVLLIDRGKAFPGWWALLPTLGAAFLIASGPHATFNRVILSQRLMVSIGLVSYQLYLWHWPLLVFESHVLASSSTTITRLAALALSIPLAWVTYSFLDKPLRQGSGLTIKAYAIVVATALIGAAGLWTYSARGFPQRFPSLLQELAAYSFDYRPAYREGSCFLTPEQDAAAFDATCDAISSSSKLQRVVLWGDSHAAHLYPGLLHESRERFDLAQYTSSACAPLIGLEVDIRPHCRSINDHVLALIQMHTPDTVVLSAVWETYNLDGLEATIKLLRDAGVRRIVVAGQAPHWPGKLPDLLSTMAREQGIQRIPDRLPWPAFTHSMSIDQRVAERVELMGATFVSTTGILCEAGTCLVRTRDEANSLTSWDHAHLSAEGSKYVAEHLPAGILPGTRR